MVEQRRAALALDDAAEVQEVRTLDPEARAETRAVTVRRDVHANAHDVVGDALVREGAMHEPALFVGIEGDRARRVEQPPVHGEAQRGLVVRGGDEHGALGDERQPVDGRVVDVGEEQDRVEVPPVAAEVLEELWRDGALRADERVLGHERVSLAEGPMLAQPEVARPAGLDGEAVDGDPVDRIDARRVDVRPGPVVGSGRRGHREVGVRSQVRHELAGVGLGAAAHVPVPLHDDEDARTVTHRRSPRRAARAARRTRRTSTRAGRTRGRLPHTRRGRRVRRRAPSRTRPGRSSGPRPPAPSGRR